MGRQSVISGFVRIDSDGNPILNTFTFQNMSSQVGWIYYEIDCEDDNLPPPNSTTTYSSTTTTWTTPNPTTSSTTSTTSSSTTSTSSSTTTTTTTEITTSTSTTSSTTTTTTTEVTTTTSTTSSTTTTTTTEEPTTTTTTSSTTTTTTTAGETMDIQVAVEFVADTNMAGTTVTQVFVNNVLLNLTYPIADGFAAGDFVAVAPSYDIEVYIDRSGSINPPHVQNFIRVQIKDNVIGLPTAVYTTPSGLTSTGPDIIAFTTTTLTQINDKIVITGEIDP